MKIALDYDGTYTIDPLFWDEFKKLADEFGHQIVCVTKRGKDNKDPVPMEGMRVHYTNRKAKGVYCKATGIKIDVWIDDEPENIFKDG